MEMRKLLSTLTLAGMLGGCISTPPVASTQPATDVDPLTADPSYWYAQPPAATAAGGDFETLWAAADATARGLLFNIDRIDRRNGVLTTEPTVSSQVFEPWRSDQRTAYDTAQSTVAAIRRTIRFEFTKQENGNYAVTPKVLVERYSQAENRVTNVVLYRGAFRPARLNPAPAFGTRETDRGIFLDARYWYATGRDTALEHALVEQIEKRLK